LGVDISGGSVERGNLTPDRFTVWNEITGVATNAA
jgi:hypothetical protein